MAKPETPFTEAAAALADEAMSRQFSRDVTANDALDHITPDVFVAWIAQEALTRDDEIIVSDTLAQRLTSQVARTLLCAVAIDHAAKVQQIVKEAFYDEIARDLAYAAQKLVDNWEPTDDEMSRSYAVEVDDPLIADRRHMARAYRHA
jgi:putative ubiquitin-RnfH superfamily antitoxin RatB of RatAB toxin-antitoxin module